MKIALLAALVFVSLPCLSRAEGLDRNNETSFRLGAYSSGAKIKLDAEDDVADGGGAAGIRYIRNIDPLLGIGIEANYLNAGEHESPILINNAISNTKLSTTDILGVVRVRFLKEHFRPYLLGGFGLHSSTLQLDTRPRPGFFWADTGTTETRTLIDSTKTGVALALEGGFDYHFNPSISAGAFLAWHFQSEQTYEGTPTGQSMGLAGVKGSFSGVMLGGSLTARF